LKAKGGIKVMDEDKSREKLKRTTDNRVTNLFQKILDFVEVICPTKESYKAMRSKILGLGNDCIRQLKKDIDHYEVKYKSVGEELIEVRRSSK
jgi:hypothetical protein